VRGHYEIRLTRYLSGARLLSHQTFVDLFPSETIVSSEGLGVTELALLFTDITGSTALYERIGDVRAFQLVQQHFGLLRDVIARRSGALVKTIGDAVMASFHRPLDALSAALEMRRTIERFNETAGAEMISLKMGVHTGACLAVTLNGQLDYFGQAVNLAVVARRHTDSSVSPGATRLKVTGTASAARAPSCSRMRTNADVARSPSSGKSVR
jgi:class 3 adenylate cyclase